MVMGNVQPLCMGGASEFVPVAMSVTATAAEVLPGAHLFLNAAQAHLGLKVLEGLIVRWSDLPRCLLDGKRDRLFFALPVPEPFAEPGAQLARPALHGQHRRKPLRSHRPAGAQPLHL